jgi:hypothetical protein
LVSARTRVAKHNIADARAAIPEKAIHLLQVGLPRSIWILMGKDVVVPSAWLV